MGKAGTVVDQHDGAGSDRVGGGGALSVGVSAYFEAEQAAGAPFRSFGASQTPDRLRVVAGAHELAVRIDEGHGHVHGLGVEFQNLRPACGFQELTFGFHEAYA
jgi:hypothetical protein